ncbi:MAG: hypothetical protein ACREUW_20515 [Burkholderiales bacterium]
MGLLTKLKRDYRNAGAQISVSFQLVENLDHRENLKEPWFYCQCTGLELHNFANRSRKDFLDILNVDPEKYRSHIKIPEDYWCLATRSIFSIRAAHIDNIPDEHYNLVRDAICLVAESVFDTFENNDALFVYLIGIGDVWVERLRGRTFNLDRVRLGNINERSNKT